jgi:hypothetical protein
MALFAIGLIGLAVGAGVGAFFQSGASASNIADETVQALINVSNSASQSCVVSADQIQSANISGNTGGNYNIYEDWSQYLILNSSCIQNVTFQNNISQVINQEASQIAKTIAQQFQLSSANSKNVVNETANLSTQVSNAFAQKCLGYESQIQSFNLTNNTDVNANVYQNFEQYNASTFKCVMQDQAVNNTTQQLQQSFSQQATSTIENFFAVILGIVFAIFAVIGIIVFGLLFFRGSSSSPTTIVQQAQPSPNIDSELINLLSIQSPKTSKTSKNAQSVKVPQTIETSRIIQSPKASKTTQNVKVPQPIEVTKTSKSVQTTKAPQTMKVSKKY